MLTYNGEIYNFQELRARARGARPRVPLAHRHRGAAARRSPSGALTALERFNGMFAFALWDTRSAELLARARPLRHQAALLRAQSATRSCSARRSRRSSRIRRIAAAHRSRGACSSTSRSRISSPTGRCSRASGCCRPAATCRCRSATAAVSEPRRYWDFAFRGAGTRALGRGVPRGARPPVPAGGQPPAGQRRRGRLVPVRRHGLRARSPRSPRSSCPTCKTFTVRLRPATRPRASSSASTSARRPSTCRTCSRPSTTRWCSRPATWSACCRSSPGISRSRASARAIRTSTPRSSQASSCKVVLSGAGGDELFGGYPWRYYRAVVNDDFEHYVDKYYAFWQRLLPSETLRAVCSRRSGTTCSTSRPRDIFRERVPSTMRRADAPRGLRQPLALLRGEDLPARPARRRGQAVDGALRSRRGCRSSTTISSISRCGCRRGSSSAT